MWWRQGIVELRIIRIITRTGGHKKKRAGAHNIIRSPPFSENQVPISLYKEATTCKQ